MSRQFYKIEPETGTVVPVKESKAIALRACGNRMVYSETEAMRIAKQLLDEIEHARREANHATSNHT